MGNSWVRWRMAARVGIVTLFLASAVCGQSKTSTPPESEMAELIGALRSYDLGKVKSALAATPSLASAETKSGVPLFLLAVFARSNPRGLFASAVHYVHPDKPPELWINEVGVASSYRKRGIAKKLLKALFEVGKKLGCHEVWVLTERSNAAGMQLYKSLGGNEADQKMFSFTL